MTQSKKKFPYTKEGMKAAKKEAEKLQKLSKELFGDPENQNPNNWIIPLAGYLGITRQAVYLWMGIKRKIPQVVIMALTMKKQLDKIPDRWKRAVG